MEFNYRDELRRTLREKKTKNTNFSLRSFARILGVSPTALSDVLAGKRNFSMKNAKKVAERLCFTPQEYSNMISEICNQKKADTEQLEIQKIEEDEFKLISNWYYLGILALSEQRNIKNDPVLIGEKLGISAALAGEAIDTLVRLKLIDKKNGNLKCTSLPLRTTSDIPSYAIRNYHKENLELIRNSIDNVPVELREICSMNLNIDPKKIKKAKEMINEFKEEFTKEMEKTTPREVYTLAMHFFPTTLNRGQYE